MTDTTSELDEILLKLQKEQYPGSPLDERAEARHRIEQLIAAARLKGVEEVLLRLKQAPPIDWLAAQTWVDREYARLQEKLTALKQGGSENE